MDFIINLLLLPFYMFSIKNIYCIFIVQRSFGKSILKHFIKF